MAASRAPVIRAGRAQGLSGGIGAAVSGFLGRLDERKKEREREEDAERLQEAKDEGSRLLGRAQTEVNALRVSDAYADMDAAAQRDAINKIYGPELEAFRRMGQGRKEWDRVAADLDASRATKVDEYTSAAVKEKRKDSMQRRLADEATRYEQVGNDIRIQHERLSDPDPKVVDNATRQLPSLYDEYDRLALSSAPSESVAGKRRAEASKLRREGPLQAALAVPARRGDRNALDAVASRMRNGTLPFAVKVPKQDRDRLLDEAYARLDAEEQRTQAMLNAAEKAQERTLDEDHEGLWRLVNAKDENGEFLVSLADAQAMYTSSEGYKLGDKRFTTAFNTLTKQRKDAAQAQDAERQAQIEGGAGNAARVTGYMERLSTTSSVADLLREKTKIEADRQAGLLSDAQAQAQGAIADAKIDLMKRLEEDRKDDLSGQRRTNAKTWGDAKAMGLGVLGYSDHAGRLVPHQGIKQHHVTMMNRAMIHLDAWAETAENGSPALYEAVMDVVMARVLASDAEQGTRAKSLLNMGVEGQRLAGALAKAGMMPAIKDTAAFALIGTGRYDGPVMYDATGRWSRDATLLEVEAHYMQIHGDNVAAVVQAAGAAMDDLDRAYRLAQQLRGSVSASLFSKDPD